MYYCCCYLNNKISQIQIKEPDPIEFDNQIFDLAFHPSENIIATGLITGEVFCHRYAVNNLNENINVLSICPHKKSCRGLEFSHDGASLFSISKDRSIQVINLETGEILVKKVDSHDYPINCILRLNETTLATGDDNGIIKLWDIRNGNEIMKYSEHQDFISDFAFRLETKTLLSASGDGTLSVYDIRSQNLVAMSDNQDDELLSVAVVKDGRKVVVGTQEGIVNLYTWNNWGDTSDRIVGHPQSIDTLVKIDEDLICTGSSDGIIRLVGILPNKFLGVIGDHEDFPIECLKSSHDNNLLASCSHDNTVKFWNIRYLYEEDDYGDEKKVDKDYDNMDMDENPSGGGSKNKREGKKVNNETNSFFVDL
ncbi:WD40-repeat-containing domain protein [Glomus cerebriforme]|uniref:WD repeat-containing protein JIP5 n=1 Tax=Glomus cerebriforme TaxID=658196 RepID=A0A397SZC8_9GLOM|nr:WD40-repeat-containing domain protein [Glomus cerebriforme]